MKLNIEGCKSFGEEINVALGKRSGQPGETGQKIQAKENRKGERELSAKLKTKTFQINVVKK